MCSPRTDQFLKRIINNFYINSITPLSNDTRKSMISFMDNNKGTFSMLDNFIKGKNNTAETGTTNTIIMGENNIVKGISRNNILIGDNNEVSNGVNNATVLGNYGIAQRDGEVVIGGGAFNGVGKGYGQSSVVSLSGTTTDATQTNLKVNNSSSDTIIARSSTSSFQGFEANVLGVRTGGTAGGSPNDRIFFLSNKLIKPQSIHGIYEAVITKLPWP